MAEKESSEKKTQEYAPREYQLELLEKAIEKNIIVCLGTGTGKTFISIKFIEYLARKHNIIRSFSEGAQRTFFLVNSVPLVFQQAAAIESNTALKVKPFCGEMGVDFWSKDEWMKHFEENHVLVMTHQIYLDLLQHAKIKLAQANLLVFDECHHANKNHPFKKIMDRFADFPEGDYPRVLGLTASVVGKKVKPHQISSEIKKLERTMRCVCATASDPDVVEKYGAKPTEVFETYSCTDHDNTLAKYLEQEFDPVLHSLQKFLLDVKLSKEEGGVEEIIGKELSVSKSAISECKAALDEIGVWAAYEVSKMLVDDLERRTKRVPNRLAILFIEATQTSLREMCGIYDELKLANQCEEEIQQDYFKPKVKKLLELYRKSRGSTNLCSIVFVERRYSACVISKLINKLAERHQDFAHLSSNFVTGHGSGLYGISETDMKFNEQKKILKDFREGKFNILVGTSVVEEGVDIPKCNLVVMFDFPKNFRAYVQSKGRGRAKDARYVLLVEESEYEEKMQNLEMYQSVDDHLMTLCKDNRTQPTDEESNDAVNVNLLEPFYTEAGARVDMQSSIGLMYRYCSKLPCDRFTLLKPKFTTYDLGKEFQTTLQLPRNSPIIGLIKGQPMPNKKESKMAVALEACKKLHEVGELDDHLLPVQGSSDSDSADNDETDGSQHKTGTKKRRRYHDIKMTQLFERELRSDCNKRIYVYTIEMNAVDVFENVRSKTEKKLWDKKKHVFGIVTKNQLPQLPEFSLWHEMEVKVSLEHSLTLDNLESKHLQLIEWFHRFLFSEILEFSGCPTVTGCRIVLMGSTDSNLQAFSAKRPYSPTTITKIDYEYMRKLKHRVENWSEEILAVTDLNDAIVVKKYAVSHAEPNKTSPQKYVVTEVRQDLTTLSEFPNQSQGRTFNDYYKNKHNLDIKDVSQPLLEVIPFRYKIDCRRKPNSSSKHHVELLVPELCNLKESPQSLAIHASFLPSVLYRLQSLLAMHELSEALPTGVGYMLRNGFYEHEGFRESPSKKYRSCQPPDDDKTYSDLCNECEDICDAPSLREETSLSTLQKYFSRFDSSSFVPLFSLLEALTCASSSDAFDLERLEMLGDSFLKMAVSIYVYWHEDHKDEGKLTKYRSRQISNKNLFKLAETKGLPGYLKHEVLSKSTWSPPGYTLPSSSENGARKNKKEECSGSFEGTLHDEEVARQLIPDKSIADSVEALIGAHLTHCGYMGALKFMTWLGLKVLHEEKDTNHVSSCYAEYPIPQVDISEGEDEYRYGEILRQQTCEMETFQRNIGYVFENKVLLLEAFTHPTYSDNTITGSYQRLEFLGDAILDFLVTQHIYNHCSENLAPGLLTDLRCALVNNNIFGTIAVENDFQRYLREYSPELFSNIGSFVKAVKEYQVESGNKVNPNPFVIAVEDGTCGIECIEAPKPLGDVFESVAGAIFVDSGLDIETVWKVYYPMLKKFIDEYSENVPVNSVKAVYEFDSGAKFGMAKETEDGQVSCDLTFTEEKGSEIGHRVFTGVGRNKHNAKLSAAYKAMKIIRNLPNRVHHRNGR